MVSRRFLVFLRYTFHIFLHICLSDCVRFQYSQVLVILLFSQRSYAFLIYEFCSFHSFCYPIFHYEHGTFSGAQFHSDILTVYFYCLYLGLLFFFRQIPFYHLCILLLLSLLLLFYPFESFQTSVSRWFLTEVLVKTSLLKFPGFFSVCWSILTMPWFGWSLLILLFISLPVPKHQSLGDCTKSTNYDRYHRHCHVPQFFQFSRKVEVLILLFAFFQFYPVVSRNRKFSFFFFFFFFFGYFSFYCRSLGLIA